ncbi:MAG: cell division protein FtsI [Deltaproteobacteria bacterium SG8_13]|nr:MAG: cell division protein FtsI [Deltaproteobacteria bacterium SG8_13]
MMSRERKFVRLRIVLIALVFSLFFTVIAAKTVYLQLYQGTRLADMAAEQVERSYKTAGKRGTIFDRNGAEMAVSIQVTSVAANPQKIPDARKAAAAVGRVLKIDRRSLSRKFSSSKPFVWVKRQASPKEVERVRALGIEGIEFVPETNRFYPSKTLAAQVIGFTGIDGNGLEGLEYYYDSYLRGAEGNRTILRDALGQRFVSPKQTTKDYSGQNIVLTIDRTVQYIAEQVLEETVSEFSALSGIALVMIPKTGAVLAMAHYPPFNPNDYRNFSRQNWRNRAITDPIEPGSTMKIFSATAAIESGGSSPNTIFYCENGAYRIGKNIVHDLYSYGWLSLQQIIKYSSNIGAIKISEMVGPERLYNTLSDFGFNTRTGIDCPGESTGSLAYYKQWSRLDTGVISFGHGIATTPLQLATAVSAIANRGELMKPYLVKAITDSTGRLVHSFEPRSIRRVISPETAATVAGIMATVITKGGTGTAAALDGYSVCGKTGTAKKVSAEGAYTEGKYVASFVGFTPAHDPEITVLVIVNEPQDKYYGGLVAAPAFRKIAGQTLNYLNVPPDIREDQTAMQSASGVKS